MMTPSFAIHLFFVIIFTSASSSASLPFETADVILMPKGESGEKFTVDDCKDKCEVRIECEFYVFVPLLRECFLFEGKEPDGLIQACEFQTGRKIRSNNRISFDRRNKAMFVGATDASAGPKECRLACQRSDGCRSFAWFGPDSQVPQTCVKQYFEPGKALFIGPGGDVVSGLMNEGHNEVLDTRDGGVEDDREEGFYEYFLNGRGFYYYYGEGSENEDVMNLGT